MAHRTPQPPASRTGPSGPPWHRSRRVNTLNNLSKKYRAVQQIRGQDQSAPTNSDHLQPAEFDFFEYLGFPQAGRRTDFSDGECHLPRVVIHSLPPTAPPMALKSKDRPELSTSLGEGWVAIEREVSP